MNSEFVFCGLCTKCVLGNVLGSGANGKVYECLNNTKYVLKQTDDPDDLKGEVNYMKLSHPSKYKHVVKMFPVAFFKNRIVMDKVQNILIDYLNQPNLNILLAQPPLINSTAKSDEVNLKNERIIFKLIDAISFLHESVKYSHNDLKPQNIGFDVVKETEQVKFIDMGASKPIRFQNDGERYQELDFTLPYASPLTIDGIVSNKNRDNWAIACTIFEIVAGMPLFSLTSYESIFSLVPIITGLNETKIKYLLGISQLDTDGFPIVSPYRNEADVSYNILTARKHFLNNIKYYAQKDKIIQFIYDNMVSGVNPLNSGGRMTSLLVPKEYNNLTHPKDQRSKTKKSLLINPLLQNKSFYTVDKTNKKIHITNMKQWLSVIYRMKEDTRVFENSKTFEKSLSGGGKTSNKVFKNSAGHIFKRTAISESKFLKHKTNSDSSFVKRYKLKNTTCVYYLYTRLKE